MTTSAELQASERESFEETIAALHTRIDGLKLALAAKERVLVIAEQEAAAAQIRLARVEGRLARLLRLVQGTPFEFRWTEFNGGGTVCGHRQPWSFPRRRGRAWSRRLFPRKDPTR